MKRREANAIRARQALLAAGAEEFRLYGFEGASMRRIARSAGVATGTVFNYFDGKLALLHATLHDRLERAVAEAVNVATSQPVLDQLAQIARVLLASYAGEPDLSRVLLKESLFAAGPSGAQFRAQVHAVAASVTERIHDAEVAVDAELATLTFLSAYYFGLIRLLASATPDVDATVLTIRRQMQAVLGSEEG